MFFELQLQHCTLIWLAQIGRWYCEAADSLFDFGNGTAIELLRGNGHAMELLREQCQAGLVVVNTWSCRCRHLHIHEVPRAEALEAEGKNVKVKYKPDRFKAAMEALAAHHVPQALRHEANEPQNAVICGGLPIGQYAPPSEEEMQKAALAQAKLDTVKAFDDSDEDGTDNDDKDRRLAGLLLPATMQQVDMDLDHGLAVGQTGISNKMADAGV